MYSQYVCYIIVQDFMSWQHTDWTKDTPSSQLQSLHFYSYFSNRQQLFAAEMNHVHRKSNKHVLIIHLSVNMVRVMQKILHTNSCLFWSSHSARTFEYQNFQIEQGLCTTILFEGFYCSKGAIALFAIINDLNPWPVWY